RRRLRPPPRPHLLRRRQQLQQRRGRLRQRLRPPAQQFGREVLTCPVRQCARLASISRLTGSFTPWAGAAPTGRATSLFTHLNITQALTVGPRRQPPIPTTRQITWLAAC